MAVDSVSKRFAVYSMLATLNLPWPDTMSADARPSVASHYPVAAFSEPLAAATSWLLGHSLINRELVGESLLSAVAVGVGTITPTLVGRSKIGRDHEL